MVNARIKLPTPPGPWVDSETCKCGARYKDHRSGVSFQDGVNLVRAANGEGGGFRSRGPVLWAMRVLKHADWFEAHANCGAEPCPQCTELCPWCDPLVKV